MGEKLCGSAPALDVGWSEGVVPWGPIAKEECLDHRPGIRKKVSFQPRVLRSLSGS